MGSDLERINVVLELLGQLETMGMRTRQYRFSPGAVPARQAAIDAEINMLPAFTTPELFLFNRVGSADWNHPFLRGLFGKPVTAYFDKVIRKSRGLLYGSLCCQEEDANKNFKFPEPQRERTEIFRTLGTIEKLKHFLPKMKRVLLAVIVRKRISACGTFSDSSFSEEYRYSVRNAMESQNWDEVERLIMPIAIALPDRPVVFHAVLPSAALLLSLVYQYLIGLAVDKGGTKTYSQGSLEFRSTYISVLLFQGAYVWIKFRDVAPSSLHPPSPGLHRKSRFNASGQKEYCGNYEPRFKPPGARGKPIYVGLYEHEQDAKTMYQILAFYYGKADGRLLIFGDHTYDIPPMTREEQQNLSGEAKVEFVKCKAKEVYNNYKLELDREIESLVSSFPPLCDLPLEFPGFLDATPTFEVPLEGDSLVGNQAHALGFTDTNNYSDGNGGPDTRAMLQTDAHGAFPSTLPELSVGLPPQTATNARAEATAVPSEQRHLQEYPENHSASNVIFDDVGLRRQVREMLHQQELRDIQIAELQQQHQLEVLRKENQISELRLQDQQKDSRIVELQRLHQRDHDQISKLQGEIESLRSTERVCKRQCCYGAHS